MKHDWIKEVFRRIASGEEPHGDFLTKFSWALGSADADNFQLLTPVAQILMHKYRLAPIEFKRFQGAELEDIVQTLAMHTDSRAAVLALLRQENRVEVVAGLIEDVPDLAEILQKLADRVKDGDGMPLGAHGHIITQP